VFQLVSILNLKDFMGARGWVRGRKHKALEAGIEQDRATAA
jgi:hypothetical protein